MEKIVLGKDIKLLKKEKLILGKNIKKMRMKKKIKEIKEVEIYSLMVFQRIIQMKMIIMVILFY